MQGLPIADGLITDITGWGFVRVARELGYATETIEAFLDGFGQLFEPDQVAASPVSRRLLGSALDNVSFEDAALHLTGRKLVDFRSALPPKLVPGSDARDGNDLHVVWAVVDRDADVLCASDKGFPVGRRRVEAMSCDPAHRHCGLHLHHAQSRRQAGRRPKNRSS